MPYLNPDEKRARQRRRYHAQRDAFIDSRGGACESCGSTDRLEIDHIDRSMKSLNVRDVWNRTAEIRDAELAKCQVLCNGCHLEKTVAENLTAEHGSHTMYVKGCRCDACKAGHAEVAREYRARTRAA